MATSKVFNGVIWASIQRFGNLGISFISNMIMARLLTPDDFGTIGMLLFFIAMAQTFVDSGFGAALIQKKEITNEDVCTVFYVNMGISFIAYIILFVSAPYIADFYSVPILCDLLRVQSIVVLIQGMTLIQSVQLTKRLDFKKLSVCNLTGTVILALTGIIAAYCGMGVWSLVIRTLAGTIATSIMLWTIGHWRPSLIFSTESFKQLFNFGGFMLLSSLMITISNNIQSLILGKLFAPSVLGNFTQARTLRNISSESISSVIGQVLYPDFSNHQDNDALIKQKLERSAYLLSYIVSAIMALCILVAEPLINLIYGNQWNEAIPYFQILCLGGIPLCLQDININVIKAKGKSKELFICNVLKVIFYIVIMLLGAFIAGIYGFIWMMVVYSVVAYIAFAVLGTYYIRTNILKQLSFVFKSITISGIPFTIIVFIHKYIFVENYTNWLIIDCFLYVSFFVILSILSKCYPFFYLKGMIFKKNYSS